MSVAISTPSESPPAGLTYEEFLEWAGDKMHAEWIDGHIVIMSPASREHQRIFGFLYSILKLHVEEHVLGEVIPAPFQMRLREARSGREPDLLFVGVERLNRIRETYVDGPADFVVEVVSPESRGRDLLDKLKEYSDSGVREYWIVDPFEKRLLDYRHDEGELRLMAHDDRVESNVVRGFWIEESWLWEDPAPTTRSVMAAWGMS